MDLWSISQYFEKASLEQLREWRRIVLEAKAKGDRLSESAAEILKTIDFYLSLHESTLPTMFTIENEPTTSIEVRIH